MSKFKTILISASIGAVLGAVYNTTLFTPWAEDLAVIKDAYYACEANRLNIAHEKGIDPKRFNTCSIFFYYDVTEETETGRFLEAKSVDTMHMKWVNESLSQKERDAARKAYQEKRKAEDERAAVPREMKTN